MDFNEVIKMKMISALIGLLLAACLALQGCGTAPNEKSEYYRVLSIPVMDSIQAGMSKAQVIDVLGQPWHTLTYSARPDEMNYQWKWRNSSDEGMLFGVVFDKNWVVQSAGSWRDLNDPKNIGAPSWN
jgi:hypothetical protein